MKSDEEFGESAEPKMYSYFEEIFKRPAVKNWLHWSDEEECFVEADRLNEFYSWMIPDQDHESSTPKLPEAKNVRDLASILGDESALNVLRGADGSLTRALARYEVDHPGRLVSEGYGRNDGTEKSDAGYATEHGRPDANKPQRTQRPD